MRDTKYQKFDIRPVLERLLLKGSIVVKKAYCDWERYKEFKAPMHEANFELIEIPHVRQSGKNSADIRLVVDALDFCYTKSHVNTFVIISGDSDFSPLVSKLRENDKKVIGVGVKQSTSDLLIANCDEFIFYDDLAREGQRAADARRDNRGGGNAGQRRSPDEERRRKEELEARKTQAVDMVVETFEALMAERGDSGKIWASALKDALKRRRPDFNESYYGFRAFGNLLDEAQSRGFLEVGREEKSGTYVYRDSAGGAAARAGGRPAARAQAVEGHDAADAQPAGSMADTTEARPARGTRGGRKNAGANSRGGRQEGARPDGQRGASVDESQSHDAGQAWQGGPGRPEVATAQAPLFDVSPATSALPDAPPLEAVVDAIGAPERADVQLPDEPAEPTDAAPAKAVAAPVAAAARRARHARRARRPTARPKPGRRKIASPRQPPRPKRAPRPSRPRPPNPLAKPPARRPPAPAGPARPPQARAPIPNKPPARQVWPAWRCVLAGHACRRGGSAAGTPLPPSPVSGFAAIAAIGRRVHSDSGACSA
ncbi:NYN domain-containing protein [Achromobacter xylosoxidans]